MGRRSPIAVHYGVLVLALTTQSFASSWAEDSTRAPALSSLASLTVAEAAAVVPVAASAPQETEGAAAMQDAEDTTEWKIGGEVNVSYVAGFDSDTQELFGRVFDAQGDQFTLHQAELWIERSSTPESPFGFSIDVVAGDDAELIHAAGLGDSSDSFDLTQAYLSYQVPGVDGLQLQAGKFVTLHGAELIRRSGNFHASRSFLFGFAIPFTHTGVLATYEASTAVTVTGGIVNGWDNADDNNDDKSVHAMVGLSPTESFSLTIGGTYGAEQEDSSAKRSLIDVIATFTPTDRLTLMLNYDIGEEEEIVFDPSAGRLVDANWDGLAGYIAYEVNDVVSIGARAEYFSDDEGVRFGFSDPVTGGPAELELWEATFTARFKLHDDLAVSLEFRHDEASDNRLVFGGGTDDTQDTFAIDFVGTF